MKHQTKYTLPALLIFLSAYIGWEVRPIHLANYAHDAMTITRKNLDPSCFYDIHQNQLIAICPHKQ
ncbi:hypothetical protein YU52_003397 [Salmonella enterica subsp. enterica serovar Java]|nr:hypothetical protein [Salmonella enterica]EBP4807942.1 hypothetical protein [Salmonella enterica]EDW6387244.1 hypothetical protein [Salmonella enterica subsp. enterica serovar Java]